MKMAGKRTRKPWKNGKSEAKTLLSIGPVIRVPLHGRKTGKTTRQPEIESSFLNNRNCKNTAVGCAGQARTTICSIFLGLRRINLGNPGNWLCKTAKAAPFGQNLAQSGRIFGTCSSLVSFGAGHKAQKWCK
jgi:hypothetical protein